jgi:NADH:ubiquinone oxidoreductase subunit 6 (subunit J)
MIDRRRKGFGLIVNTAVAVVIVAVALVIGIYVIGSIQQALPSSNLPQEAADNISKIFGSVYSAYSLMPIMIIVLIAAAIIGTIFIFGGRSPTK